MSLEVAGRSGSGEQALRPGSSQLALVGGVPPVSPQLLVPALRAQVGKLRFPA